MTEIIHLPGIGNSGKSHWHTLWEDADPAIRRFAPTSWDDPDCSDWVTALEKAVCAAQTPPILVAHSLACLLVAHWHQVSDLPVRGAMLVAVPDPLSPAFPSQARSFADAPQRKFRFPSLIVASTDDPYGSLPYVQTRAEQWGCDLTNIGAAGHINGESELGNWPEGLALLSEFESRV